MGFGTIIANVVMFISILLLATMVMGTFKNVIQDSSNSMRAQSDILSDKMKTDFEITSANYTPSNHNLTFFALNTGKTTLDLDYVDVFVNQFLINRSSPSRNITIETEVKNTGLWDPREYIRVVVSIDLPSDTTNVASITGPYGNRADKEFSYP